MIKQQSFVGRGPTKLSVLNGFLDQPDVVAFLTYNKAGADVASCGALFQEKEHLNDS